MHPRFHLAIPVNDLAAARAFYGTVLGCPAGRSAERWADFDLYGHQLVVHVAPGAGDAGGTPVDGEHVPVPHFGVILSIPVFEGLAERIRAAGVRFIIPPTVRFAGLPGEQHTMFFRDPSGNALEFKAFADDAQVFAT
ncbi:MAG: extradiol dioxygenase family protein [Myxococcota bacterium]|jgi:extradiol dioxygenase family protein